MNKGTIVTVILAVCATLGAVPMIAQDEKSPSDPSFKETMEAVEKLAAPGEEHARLEFMVGHWDLKGKFRMEPKGPWNSFHAVTRAEWILGGRFLTQKTLGGATEWMPRPYEGFSIMGYDKIKQKYVVVGVENYSTGVTAMEGTFDAGTRTITMMGVAKDPAGNDVEQRSTLVFDSKDRYVHRGYSPGPEGNEFESMEIIFTRRKR